MSANPAWRIKSSPKLSLWRDLGDGRIYGIVTMSSWMVQEDDHAHLNVVLADEQGDTILGSHVFFDIKRADTELLMVGDKVILQPLNKSGPHGNPLVKVVGVRRDEIISTFNEYKD